MNRLLLYLSLLCFAVDLSAQLQTIQFQVRDQKTNQTLPFCYAQITGKKASAVADDQGFIAIKVERNDTLIVHQLAYFTKKIPVQAIISANNQVFLNPKDIQLDAVTISAKKLQVFEENNNLIFIDFEFYNDLLLCLVNKGNKFNVLQIRDANGYKVLEKKLSIKAEQIFKDCYGNLHLVSTDSIYQVYYNYRQLLLLPPYPIADYNHILKPCVCAVNDKAIFKLVEYQQLKNAYLYFDLLSGERKTMACVADSEAISGFNMDYDIMYFLGQRRKGYGYAYSVTELNKYIDKLRAELVLPFEYKNLMRPVESQLINIDTNFVIFDFTNKQVYNYGFSGKFIEKKAISNFPPMLPKVHYDKDAGSIVLSELNNRTGILTLYRYNPSSNKLSHRCQIENMHYIKNYQIKENFLYVINHEKTQVQLNNKLLKLQITWQKM